MRKEKSPCQLVYSSTSKIEKKVFLFFYPHTLMDKPCHNSSCEPTATGRRSKKTHGFLGCARSL